MAKENFSSPRLSTKALVSLVVVGAVMAVSIVWLITLTVSNGEPEAKPQQEEKSELAEVPSSARSLGTVEDQKKEVLKEANKLLRSAEQEVEASSDYQTLLLSLQEGKLSSLSPAFRQQFRFKDIFAEEPSLEAASYIAVLHLSTLTADAAAAANRSTTTPLNSEAWQSVYIDTAARQAYVPLSLYLGTDASFSLSFNYVNKEWTFTPYGLLDAIQAAERGAASAG